LDVASAAAGEGNECAKESESLFPRCTVLVSRHNEDLSSLNRSPAYSLGKALRVAASESPGHIGVYVGFEREIKSPELLRQAMKQIKAAGIDLSTVRERSTPCIGTVRLLPES
jgi:hypothetical protein